MKINRKLPRTVIVAGTVTMLLATGTGTGTALADTTPASPHDTKPPVSYTKVTFEKDGRQVTEEVPTASLGLVTASSGLTSGGNCALGFIKFGDLGALAADANDGASLKDLFLGDFLGGLVPHLECIPFLTEVSHQVRHPKTAPDAVQTTGSPTDGDDG